MSYELFEQSRAAPGLDSGPATLPLQQRLPSTLGLEKPSVRVEWHSEWSDAVTSAFNAMPYDPLMPPEYIQKFWQDGAGRCRQKIALLYTAGGEVVGIVPLRKRGKLSWQLLTQYVMPYARFYVRPAYIGAALHALRAEIDCDNVSFCGQAPSSRMLLPEDSWVVALPPTYAELVKRTSYAKKDRQCRQRSAALTLREDDFKSIPEAMDSWQAKWLALGSPATAQRKDEMLLSFSLLAESGSLKTFSLHSGDKLAAMQLNLVARNTLYAMTTITLDEYRSQQAGIRCLLAAMEWACASGVTEYDLMRTGSHTKQQWADPQVRGYRVVRSPFGSELLGCTLENLKDYLRQRKAAKSKSAAH